MPKVRGVDPMNGWAISPDPAKRKAWNDRQERFSYNGLLGGVEFSRATMGKIFIHPLASEATKLQATRVIDDLIILKGMLKSQRKQS